MIHRSAYLSTRRRPSLGLLIVFCALIYIAACSSQPSNDNNANATNVSDHYDGKQFYNPYWPNFDKSIWDIIRLRYFSDLVIADNAANTHRVPLVNHIADLRSADPEVFQLTWLGHASFLIQYRGIAILTDPILSPRASPLPFAGYPRLVAMPVGIPDLPAIDYVVISHNHYDHLDINTIKALGHSPQYLVPAKLGKWFTDLGIPPDRVHELDWWENRNDGNITATATPSQHWSGRGVFDRFDTLWASWHVQIADKSFWFAGDTGYNPHQFIEIGERFGGVDLALIPIGAYHPRSFLKEQHVDPEQAIQIHKDVRAKQSIGMHWGTFQLSAEAIDEPAQLIDQARREGKISKGEFTTMAIGETRQLP